MLTVFIPDDHFRFTPIINASVADQYIDHSEWDG